MRAFYFSIALRAALSVAASFSANAQSANVETTSISTSESTSNIPTGRRLREIVEEKFPDGGFAIGGTTSLGDGLEKELAILNREFAYVTPEKDFKQSQMRNDGTFDFNKIEPWVRNARTAHQMIRAHAPIGPQCTKWAKEDTRTPEELRSALLQFAPKMDAWCNQVPEIKWLDVVNETVLPNGEFHGPKPGADKWENPWPTMGVDEESPIKSPIYIREAFEIANREAPKKKLVFNQHVLTPKAWEKLRDTMAYLLGRGLRIDGFGLHAHIDVGWEKNPINMQVLAESIDWCHARKIEYHITEMNVFLPNGKVRSEADWKAQADTYRAVIALLLEKTKTGVVTCNFWGLLDRRSESPLLKGKDGRLFDENGRAKPAYYAIQELLENQPARKPR